MSSHSSGHTGRWATGGGLAPRCGRQCSPKPRGRRPPSLATVPIRQPYIQNPFWCFYCFDLATLHLAHPSFRLRKAQARLRDVNKARSHGRLRLARGCSTLHTPLLPVLLVLLLRGVPVAMLVQMISVGFGLLLVVVVCGGAQSVQLLGIAFFSAVCG